MSIPSSDLVPLLEAFTAAQARMHSAAQAYDERDPSDPIAHARVRDLLIETRADVDRVMAELQALDNHPGIVRHKEALIARATFRLVKR